MAEMASHDRDLSVGANAEIQLGPVVKSRVYLPQNTENQGSEKLT